MAEDVVQEAALIGLEKFGQFEPGTNFTAWMGQMVRHVALNVGRKEKRHRDGALLAGRDGRAAAVRSEGVNPTAQNAGDAATVPIGDLPEEQQLFDDQVVRALKDISATARACLLLRTVEGFDYREISRLLGIPEGTAMSHVHRSRIALRAKLSGRSGQPGLLKPAGTQSTQPGSTGSGPSASGARVV